VKDLSVHRTTVELFELANAPRFSRNWPNRTRIIRALLTAITGLTVAAFCAWPLAAQEPSDPPTKPESKPRAPKSETTGKETKPADSESADAGDSVFTMSDPKTTDEDWKKWSEGSARADYNNRVRNGDVDSASMQVISNGIKMQIYAMTLPTQRDNLGTLVASLLRSVHTAADSKDPATQRSIRQAMMREIIRYCKEIGGNQFYVRLNAAILLGNLFIVPETPANHGAAEFFSEAFQPLIDVLERPGQPQGVKLAAVNGLRNAANFCIPPLQPSQKIALAMKLRNELEKTDTCEWYQERLCETLGSLDQVLDLDGRPFIVHALAKALFDHNRPLCARAAAAKALGRAPLPSSIDLNVVAYGIADLSRQIVEARNERKKHVGRWCISNIFLAFRPKDATEKAHRAGLLDRVDEPSLQKFRPSIKEVYALVRPMVVQELKETDSAFAPEIGEHLADWLKNHTPAQMRVAPGLPLITTTQVTKTEGH
jgi:hypothetical protein